MSHGGRGRFPARPMSRGQQEARGARQRVALCFGTCGGRVRVVPSGAMRARAKAFWNCVSGFATVRKRLVQANACSGRPRRDPWVAVRMALHSMAHRAAAALILLCRLGRCAPASLLGLSPLPVRCALGPASHDLSVLRAARGQRVLCGTEWTLCAPTGGGALVGARGLRFRRRARLLSRESGRACDPNPYLTLRTHVLQPARFVARRACGDGPPSVRACFVSVRRSVGGAAGRARSVLHLVWYLGARAARQATWLILPVVICLSQRLSHACLSISDLYCETANGSLNQLWFL